MKEKKVLSDLTRAYSTSFLKFDEKDYVVYASEAWVDKPGEAYAFPLDDKDNKEIIWNDAGGCMGIIQHPSNKNEFLAVQEFYLSENPSRSKIVWMKRNEQNKYITNDYVKIPYLHRFGLVKDGNKIFLVASTIAKNKTNKDDWSEPGEIWVGELGENCDEKMEMKLLVTGLFRNHGFFQTIEDGKDIIYTASDEGVLRINRHNNKFNVNKILDKKVSEIAVCDIDNDGKLELITIEPFHGNSIKIYHYNNNNQDYEVVWEYNEEIEFAHALSVGNNNGKYFFAAGVRKKNAELFMVTFENGNYKYEIIDENVGPANIAIFNYKGNTLVSASNHTKGECALYKI